MSVMTIGEIRQVAQKVAMGSIQATAMLKDVPVNGFDKLFPGQEATVENLF